jgi:hypothetical protein
LQTFKKICKIQIKFVYLRHERKKRFKFIYGGSGGVCHPETRWCDNVVVVVGFIPLVDSHRILVDFDIHWFNNSISGCIEIWQKKTVNKQKSSTASGRSRFA